jgi:hypothetical protein
VSFREGLPRRVCAVNVEMAESKGMADGSVEGGRKASASSLEELLQEAWMRSQMPKVQRRSVSAPIVDVSVEKRASSQPSAELLWGVVSGRAGDVDELAETYFHKTRSDWSSEVLEKPAPPRLESFSEKTDVPRSSSSNFTVTSRGSGSASTSVAGSSSQDSRSTTFSTGDSLWSDVQTPTIEDVLDGLDFEGANSGYADLAAQTEPLANFFDDYLTDVHLEDEKSLVQETSAYDAMAQEIAALLGPSAAPVDESGEPEVVEEEQENYWSNAEYLEDICEVEKSSEYQAMAKEIAELLSSEGDAERPAAVNEANSIGGVVCPTEEQTTLKMMEGYTRMLSKHIMDLHGVSSSDNVDYRSWITESDKLDYGLDEAWAAYLESLLVKASSSAIENRLHLLPCGPEWALALSQTSADIPPGITMTELLYRYGHQLQPQCITYLLSPGRLLGCLKQSVGLTLSRMSPDVDNYSSVGV